jgi:hypothetical protein
MNSRREIRNKLRGDFSQVKGSPIGGMRCRVYEKVWGPAHMSYGYTLKEIADYLGIHYTTVSKVIGRAEVNKKLYFKA